MTVLAHFLPWGDPADHGSQPPREFHNLSPMSKNHSLFLLAISSAGKSVKLTQVLMITAQIPIGTITSDIFDLYLRGFVVGWFWVRGFVGSLYSYPHFCDVQLVVCSRQVIFLTLIYSYLFSFYFGHPPCCCVRATPHPHIV